MNISDVEKLVGLIENTKDEEVKCMLRKLLATLVAKEGALTKPGSYQPWVIEEEAVNLLWEKPKCKKCNLELGKLMSYSCPHIDCPCGMGPMCTTPTTGY